MGEAERAIKGRMPVRAADVSAKEHNRQRQALQRRQEADLQGLITETLQALRVRGYPGGELVHVGVRFSWAHLRKVPVELAGWQIGEMQVRDLESGSYLSPKPIRLLSDGTLWGSRGGKGWGVYVEGDFYFQARQGLVRLRDSLT